MVVFVSIFGPLGMGVGRRGGPEGLAAADAPGSGAELPGDGDGPGLGKVPGDAPGEGARDAAATAGEGVGVGPCRTSATAKPPTAGSGTSASPGMRYTAPSTVRVRVYGAAG